MLFRITDGLSTSYIHQFRELFVQAISLNVIIDTIYDQPYVLCPQTLIYLNNAFMYILARLGITRSVYIRLDYINY